MVISWICLNLNIVYVIITKMVKIRDSTKPWSPFIHIDRRNSFTLDLRKQGECGTDDDTYRHIYHISLDSKFLKFTPKLHIIQFETIVRLKKEYNIFGLHMFFKHISLMILKKSISGNF